MATEKGLFKDDLDRHTAAHQEMCLWFMDHADLFVRRFFYDRPLGKVSVIFEGLVTDKSFLIGYADVLLKYKTDTGAQHCALIEVKSGLGDLGATLRQIKTYCQYLPEVTKSCLVHRDARFEWFGDDDVKMRKFFGSQGIYVEDFDRIELNYLNPARAGLPSGRRKARIGYFNRWREGDFCLIAHGMGFDDSGADSEDTTFVTFELKELEELARNFGVDPSPLSTLGGADNFALGERDVLVDIELPVGTEGYPVQRCVAVHAPDLSWSIQLRRG